MQDQATLLLPAELGAVDFKLYDMMGREAKRVEDIRNGYLSIQKGILPEGMYIYTLTDELGRQFSSKLVIE